MYNNLLDIKLIKIKNKLVDIKKEDGKIIITNKSKFNGKLIFKKIFKNVLDYTSISFYGNVIKGNNLVLKLINRKKEIIEKFNLNSTTCINKSLKYFLVELEIFPESIIEITNIGIKYTDKLDMDFISDINSENLIITTSYPSSVDDTTDICIHNKIKEYINNGINYSIIDVIDTEYVMIYEYDGIKVFKISYSILREILLIKFFKIIMIYHLNIKIANILDAVNINNTNILFYMDEKSSLLDNYKKYDFINLVDFISRYNRKNNVSWVFYKEFVKNASESIIDIKYSNYKIIDKFISIKDKNLLNKDINLIKDISQKKIDKYKYNYNQPVDIPILTIAVPAYNVEKYLKNSIFSLINHKLSNKIEVLIINDGSKDNTKIIGQELQDMTTFDGNSIVRLINKENGGHGSAINVGIELARGKYFKLMDGDDYLKTDELVKLIEILEKEDTDLILTNYVEDSSVLNVHRVINHYDFMKPGHQYKMEELVSDEFGFGKWGPLLATSTYRTELLKNSRFKISENRFYVDMEYNLNGFLISNTVKYYPLNLYVYYIGRSGQSVSQESFIKNYKDHEYVTMRLISELYNDKRAITPKKKYYFINNAVLLMIQLQYNLTFDNFKSLKQFFEFDNNLKKYPEIYNMEGVATKKVKIGRIFKNKTLAKTLLAIINIFNREN